MDTVFSLLVVHKKRHILESMENGTDADLWHKGSHYHFIGEDRPIASFAGGPTLMRFSTEMADSCPGTVRGGASYVFMILLAQMILTNRR